jgi:trans-aconitate methyltransferase
VCSPEQESDNRESAVARSAAIVAAVQRALPDASLLTLLDYGCGQGTVGQLLATHFGRVILVDNDAEALAAAAEMTAPNVTIRLLDLTRTVPADLRADVVLCAMSWHHVVDLDTLLGALLLVAPGGRLFVADLDADGGAYHADLPDFDGHDGFGRAELATKLEGYGYADVTVDDLWQGYRWTTRGRIQASVFLLSATVPNHKLTS